MKNRRHVTPILKWVGGKRQLLPEINKYIPEKITTYYEPFIGGGAVLFNLQPHRAILNDVNDELINLYRVVRDNVDELIADLGTHKNDADYFYQIRGLDRDQDKYEQLTSIQRASRIHYLNKTCYNGLFRVNSRGEFNAPYGRYKNPNIINEVNIRAVSDYFNRANVTFLCGDFAETVKGIRKGSFVYFDPPYDPVSTSASFTSYDKGGFNRHEQQRLKILCDDLNARGIKFLLSNSATDFIVDLYKDYKIELVKSRRVVNSRGDKRGEVDEVLVMNYEQR